MEPGRWETSGGKSAQPRGESGDKTADCRIMYAQELWMAQSGTDLKSTSKTGAKGTREKLEGGYGVVLYIPRTEAKHYEPECVQAIFLGLRGERSCDYGIASAETDKIPTPKTTLPL